MTTLAYLATPYTKYPGGIENAFRAAAHLAGRLLKSGVHVYSPIAHGHAIATHGELDPLDHAIWLPFDQLMMARCDTLIVARLESWADSFGMRAEIEYFVAAKKPVFDLDPATLSMVRRP